MFIQTSKVITSVPPGTGPTHAPELGQARAAASAAAAGAGAGGAVRRARRAEPAGHTASVCRAAGTNGDAEHSSYSAQWEIILSMLFPLDYSMACLRWSIAFAMADRGSGDRAETRGAAPSACTDSPCDATCAKMTYSMLLMLAYTLEVRFMQISHHPCSCLVCSSPTTRWYLKYV